MIVRPKCNPLFATIAAGTMIFPMIVLSILLSSILVPSEAFTATTATTKTAATVSLARYSLSVTNQCGNLHECDRRGHRNNPSNTLRLNAAQSDVDNPQRQSEAETLKAEAEALKAQAEQLRSEIEQETQQRKDNNTDKSVLTGKTDDNGSDTTVTTTTTTRVVATDAVAASPWAVVSAGPSDEGDREFRLYVSIGREDGSWMDPRWGASGKRIEFALDIKLLASGLATPEVSKKMVKDNTVGKSSPVFSLETAPFARLRDGFDRMECKGGAYRIDTGKSGRNTLRMYVEVEGTTKADQSYIYGDVAVPAGCLYFSLPCFGRGIDNLSIKEGVASVRQIGWHTGWRREESRICGVFTAKPLLEAKKRDPY